MGSYLSLHTNSKIYFYERKHYLKLIFLSELFNIEQCPTRYILDVNRRNVKVTITIKEKILK